MLSYIELLSRVPVPNEPNGTFFELKAGSMVWTMNCIMICFGIPFELVRGYQTLERSTKVGGYHPQVERCTEVFSAKQLKLEYREDSGYEKGISLSCLPVVATQLDIDRDSRLTHPDDVDVYYFGASGLGLRMITSGSANSQTPVSEVSAFGNGSQSFLRIPLEDENFKERRSLGHKSQFPCITISDKASIDVFHSQKVFLSGQDRGQQNLGETTVDHDQRQ